MRKIILFNGPARSGKDTCSGMALDYLGNKANHYRFAGPLKDAVHGLFGMSHIIREHFDMVKDKPNKLFLGMTPRNAYIWMSEEVVKPRFGSDFFAKVAVNAINNMPENQAVVISDCGFEEEVKEILNNFGVQNVALVYLKREGCTFEGDSRSYVTNLPCQQYTIENNGSFDNLENEVQRVLHNFLDAN